MRLQLPQGDWHARLHLDAAQQLLSKPGPATAPPRTAAQVAKVPSLQQYQLYLVDWGYNTEPERQRAAAHGRIAVIDATEFSRIAGVAPARV